MQASVVFARGEGRLQCAGIKSNAADCSASSGDDPHARAASLPKSRVPVRLPEAAVECDAEFEQFTDTHRTMRLAHRACGMNRNKRTAFFTVPERRLGLEPGRRKIGAARSKHKNAPRYRVCQIVEVLRRGRYCQILQHHTNYLARALRRLSSRIPPSFKSSQFPVANPRTPRINGRWKASYA